MVTAYIGLGSNLGDRRATLRRAIEWLNQRRGITVTGCSTVLETRPIGVHDQPNFLNAVVEVRTTLKPEALLDAMHQVEGALGRVRQRRWGPRTIDLDLLLYNREHICVPGLCVPHPEIRNRPFVMAGLEELGADLPDEQ